MQGQQKRHQPKLMPSSFLVGRQGDPMRAGRAWSAAAPAAPCVLRWSNAHAFASAPHPLGFDPMQGQQKRHQPKLMPSSFLVGRQGDPMRAGRAWSAAAPAAPCVLRWSNAHAFASAPHPLGFDPMQGQQKRHQPKLMPSSFLVGRQGVEPWTLGLRVPCSTN